MRQTRQSALRAVRMSDQYGQAATLLDLLTRPSLLKALTESGWAVQELVDHENWAGAGARAWLGCVRPGAQSDVRSDASTG